jgi:ferritin-like metal-binding protein YciE
MGVTNVGGSGGEMELSGAEELLQETLVEEENTDELFSELAEDAVNPAAAAA